jgi:hypothetical protein
MDLKARSISKSRLDALLKDLHDAEVITQTKYDALVAAQTADTA